MFQIRSEGKDQVKNETIWFYYPKPIQFFNYFQGSILRMAQNKEASDSVSSLSDITISKETQWHIGPIVRQSNILERLNFIHKTSCGIS